MTSLKRMSVEGAAGLARMFTYSLSQASGCHPYVESIAGLTVHPVDYIAAIFDRHLVFHFAQ